ncbi:hypothetical protein AKJ63_00010 [candidate division MSBL1 archaeon SCGC-AAA259D18]|uniref:Uncharacterized protein n=1 Tax=candidate division MSBL1 archaeon SCGC-AAA259D18 TaxID=1698262 RepID=A0A133UCU1_9EURY|nr:hypothetical protein AKJ63_00010 [candidate division MSBL1 archaeon SCGC-AAA259D18]
MWGNESLHNIKASIRNGGTTGGALDFEPSNQASVSSSVTGVKSVLGIGEPATEGVCDSGMSTGSGIAPDKTREGVGTQQLQSLEDVSSKINTFLKL